MKEFRFPLNISIPLFLLVIGMSAGTLIVLLYIRAELHQMRSDFEVETIALGSIVAAELSYALRTDDLIAGGRLIDRLKLDRNIVRAFLIDDTDRILLSTHYDQEGEDWRETSFKAVVGVVAQAREDFVSRALSGEQNENVFGIFPVLMQPVSSEFATTRAGVLLVERNLAPTLDRTLQIIYRHFAIVAAVILFMSAFVWLFLRVVLLKRMRQIVTALDQAGSIGTMRAIPVTGNDELARIAGALTGLTHRIQERNAALRASEKRFRATFEQASVGIALVGPDGRFREVNEQLATMLDFEASEMLGMPVMHISHAEDFPGHNERYEASLRGEYDSYQLELRLLGKTGTSIWVNLSVALVRDSQGAPDHFIAVVNDITERKAAEEKLRMGEERFRSFIEQASEGIFRVELLDPVPTHASALEQLAMCLQSPISECNDAMARMYGHQKAEEIEGRPAGSFFADSESLSDLTELAERFSESYQLSNVVVAQRDRTESIIWVSANITGMVENGFLVRVWGTQRDITGERIAEIQLKESERRFRGIFDSTANFIGLLSPEGRVLEVNRAAIRFIDSNVEIVRGTFFWEPDWWDRSPENRAIIRQMVKRAAAGEFTRTDIEVKNARGNRIYVSISITPVFDEDGQVVMLIPEGSDITEQTLTTIQLQQSEARLRQTFELAAVGIAHVAPNGAWLRVNQQLCDMLGYTNDELLGRTFQELTHPDDLDVDLEQTQALMTGQIKSYSMEKRYLHKEGQVIWVNLSVSLVRTADDQPDYFISVINDITERRAAEGAVRRSETIRTQIIESLEEAVLLLDPESYCVLECNKAAARIFQRPREELGALTLRAMFLVETHYTALKAACIFASNSGKGRSGVCEMCRADGESFPVAYSAHLISGSPGTPEVLTMVVRDLSEQRRSEKLQMFSAFQSGIAETATSVLHNIGNAITSVANDTNRLGRHAADLRQIAELLQRAAADSRLAPPDEANLEKQRKIQEQAASVIFRLYEEDLVDRVKRIATSVQHIAEIVRIQQSAAQPSEDQTTFRLLTLVQDAVAMHEDALLKYDITVNVDIDPNVDQLTMSRNRLLQAIINAIKNSYEAIAERKVIESFDAIIGISVRYGDSGAVQFIIEDNGIGIEPDRIEQVFSFGESTKARGSGYGLHAMALFFRELGGTVRLESDGPGKGACLFMEVPGKLSHARAMADQPME